jgi:3-phenylpropionate/trans-cinnamate dioxygenase ferredoxin reductase component
MAYSDVMETNTIVIVGGGHAGVQLCNALAAAGQGSRVQLVCAEAELPYQRPPLSKSYLKNAEEAVQSHRAEAWFAEAGITVIRGDAAVAIDRAGKRLRLASGRELPYAHLVLATGARARTLPGLPTNLGNVATLRNAADAAVLRPKLAAAPSLTVLGGGFIGLEIAATARALGKPVTVIEGLPRLLARALSPEMAEHVLQSHRAAGIDVRLGARVGEFEIDGERLAALHVDGVRTPVDLLVLGIGATPDTALAESAGLAVDNGITVDANLRTSDPAILAIGDCANYPHHGSDRRLRLESVQNATDQARTAAATLLGRDEPYKALPWFWSDQGTLRLQMAGLMPADGTRHRRPGPNDAGFSILHYAGDRLVCIETVNAPMDHMMGRKLLEAGKHPAPDVACDPAVPLKSLM